MAAASDDAYAITERGTKELKGGATTLGAHELEVLILVDGRRTGPAIASLAKGVAASQVEAVLRRLVTGGFIRAGEPAQNEGFDFFSPGTTASGPSAQAMERAAQEAANGAAALRQNGYYVSIARRAMPTSQASRKLNILVIEDELLVAKFMKVVLETEGHVVRMAYNAGQIVSQLREPPLPDIVILDLALPDASGFDVLQRMKAQPVLAEIPVVIVTGKATREGVVTGLACGADGYFTKPFEIDVLLRGIKAVLGQLPPERGSSTPPSS